METVLKIHETEDDGDVLAFLTGQVSRHVVYTLPPDLTESFKNSSHVLVFTVLTSHITFFSHIRRKWRRWCLSCRIKPGLCRATA